MLNEHLELLVKQRLLQSNELSSLPITVTADRHSVTLSGSVQSYRRKLVAQEIAESCDGVSTVINNLTVDPPNGIPDAAIANNANERLAAEVNLPNQSIRVDSRNGTLTLTGYVRNEGERQQVEDISTAADGVRDVCNLLIVNPDRALENEELANTVRAEICRTVGMNDVHLIVSIVDETARISGQVDDIWKKESAENTVRKHGILNVCNEIVVRGHSSQ